MKTTNLQARNVLIENYINPDYVELSRTPIPKNYFVDGKDEEVYGITGNKIVKITNGVLATKTHYDFYLVKTNLTEEHEHYKLYKAPVWDEFDDVKRWENW